MTETSPVADGLLMIHKIISRGLSVSLQKCDDYITRQGIPADEARGFAMYLSNLKNVTHSHHLSEDEIAFPHFESYIEAPYKRLKDDHESLSGVLEMLNPFLTEIPFSEVLKLKEVLSEFNKLWVPHIKVEEETFSAEKINKQIGIKDQFLLVKKLSDHGSQNSGPGPLVLPFFFYNLGGKDRETFMMPFPWIVKKFLVPVVWKNKWKPMVPFFLQ